MCEVGEEDCVKTRKEHVPGVVKGAVYDLARGDENLFWARHKDALHVVLEPRMCVESVRENVAVTT